MGQRERLNDPKIESYTNIEQKKMRLSSNDSSSKFVRQTLSLNTHNIS